MAPRLTFWGTRGSIAVSGPGVERHGGATPCLTLTEGRRTLVLDAGTGLRTYGRSIPPAALSGTHTVLLSHLHWDHLAGFPFFPPLYHPDATVEVLAPDQPTATAGEVLDRLLDPAVWPLATRATLRVRPVEPGALEAGGFEVHAFRLAHAGVTLGYRIRCRSGSIVSYVTDNELGAMHPARRGALVQDVAGSDVLIHDATWADEVGAARTGWGHSSAGEAVALGLDAGCRTVVLFNHDPDAADDALDRHLEVARGRAGPQGGPLVLAAADGLSLEL